MKKYFIIAAAALMAAVACDKNVAPASDFVDPDEIFDGTEKYPILFNSNVVAVKSPATKGAGSIEAWDATQKLYIYGIERVNGVLDLTDGILIDNQSADSPAADSEDGAIVVYDPAYPDEDIPFYYDYTAKYDFFGYYVDDAVVGEIVNDGAIISRSIEIDGTQDIMLAKASRENNLGIDPEKLFSAYGVRKGIQPSLKFEHQLTRLVFNVINGNGVEAEAVPELFLDSLYVESPYIANLNIVGSEMPLDINTDDTANLYLTDPNGAEFTQIGIVGTKTAGAGILVMPGQAEYPLTFVLSQNGNPIQVTQTETVKLASGANFEAGKSYKVNLTIYGLEKVQISVSLTAWDTNTEDIDLGADED